MKEILIDWNLTSACAAECPGCHFGQGSTKVISEIPQSMRKAWDMLQNATGNSVKYSHDITSPLNQISSVDFRTLGDSPASQLVLNLSRSGVGEGATITRLFTEIGTPSTRLICLVPPTSLHDFNEENDIQSFITHMQGLFALQVESLLTDVTVAFGQNQLPSHLYHEAVSAFHILYRAIKTPISDSEKISDYRTKVQPFLDNISAAGFIRKEDAYFSRTDVHPASSIFPDLVNYGVYDGEFQWSNGSQNFGLGTILSEKIPPLSLTQQIQHSTNVHRDTALALMFTPDVVYLHHSPETILNKDMAVPHEVFQQWLARISKNSEGFSGLKDAIEDYFINLA